jgi:predicted O-methyltransferase YrrM
MQANRVLEIGTGFGYSTLWIALALPPAGRLWTVDPDNDRTDVARTYLARAQRTDAVEILSQTGTDLLGTIQARNFDIIFIDAAAAEHAEYLENAVPLLKSSGLVLINRIMAPDHDQDFVRDFLHHEELDATVLPVGDGLGIGARLA